MLAKKWGILEEEKGLEDITLQQYVDMYRKPLSQSAMMAIRKLTDVAAMKKKRKELDKKKKIKMATTGIGAAERGLHKRWGYPINHVVPYLIMGTSVRLLFILPLALLLRGSMPPIIVVVLCCTRNWNYSLCVMCVDVGTWKQFVSLLG
jgi:hypothetical protein